MGSIKGMRPVRLVLDTNVVLAALVFRSGRLGWLRHAWRSLHVCPLINRHSTRELIQVLDYPKFRLATDEQTDLVEEYLPWCEAVPDPEQPPEVPECRDPSDQPFLQLALTGPADALVTGDADLLELQQQFIVPIVSARELKEWLHRP